MQYGGHFKDFAHLPRQYPENVGRPVEASITKYYGIGMHYYASLRAGENPLVDVQTGELIIPWDDPENRHLKQLDSARFSTFKAAETWIRRVMKLKRWQGYVLEWAPHSIHWHYKDGD